MLLEYIWITNSNQIRTKLKVCQGDSKVCPVLYVEDEDIILYPIKLYECPFRRNNTWLVMCDANFNRLKSIMIFDKYQSEECLIAFDQQYYIENARPSQARILAERHLEYCNQIGIKISGMSKLAIDGQWSYQTEANNPLEACDDLWMSRFILLRLSERNDINVDFTGSVRNEQSSHCFINFSLGKTRYLCGLALIRLYMRKLSTMHTSFVSLSGNDNIKESSFTWSEGDKNSSVRINKETIENKAGSFEDRRPLGNFDPYSYCALLLDVCCSN